MQSTNFVIMCTQPQLRDYILPAVVFLGPPVGISLLLWLRRGPRDARDVLGSAHVAPANLFQRLFGFWTWLLLAMGVLLVPAGVSALIHAAMFFRAEEELLPLRDWVLEPSWGWSAAAVLACSACFIYWLRASTPSERDVLRVTAQA